MKYDYLIVVGAGLFGAVFTYEAEKRGKDLYWSSTDETTLQETCLLENWKASHVHHKYGAHIFHTSNKEVWELCESVCRVQ